jgi:quercetin dioxygenase-like cupin family protein
MSLRRRSSAESIVMTTIRHQAGSPALPTMIAIVGEGGPVSTSTVAHLNDIPKRDAWIPIRHHFQIGAFGVNAYRAAEAGGRVISDHTENPTKQEELYVVVEGHATFTVDGDEVDAPTGTLLFAAPATRRSAVAKEAGTTVLVVGGRPGQAFEPGPWEEAWQENQAAMKFYREERYGEAADVLREALVTRPDAAGIYYNLACFDSKAGADAATVAGSLERAIELYPAFRDFARDDSDFDPVRDDPAIQALVGEPG